MSLSGGLVTLSAGGIVNVGYLGTEPDLNSTAPPMINEINDPEQIQKDLVIVEESLKKILNNNEGKYYKKMPSNHLKKKILALTMKPCL